MVLKWVTKQEYGARSHCSRFRKLKTGARLYQYQCAVCKRTFQWSHKVKEGETKYNQLNEPIVRTDRAFRYWDNEKGNAAH